MKSLFNHFEVLEDPRDIRGKKHELINIRHLAKLN